MAIVLAVAGAFSSLFFAFGWAYAPRPSIAVFAAALLSITAVVLLVYTIWATRRYRSNEAPWYLLFPPGIGLALVALPVIFTATFLYPVPIYPTDAQLRSHWGTHSAEIKALNEAMLKHWADGKYDVVSLYASDNSYIEGRKSVDQEIGVRLSSKDESKRLLELMGKARLFSASISSTGAWYKSIDAEGTFVVRGYFFYDGKSLGKSGSPISAERQLRDNQSVTDFTKISDDWYIYTADGSE